jgi:beta-ureidopropionase / N-carbamoyl-L-amino-acid hydrolase
MPHRWLAGAAGSGVPHRFPAAVRIISLMRFTRRQFVNAVACSPALAAFDGLRDRACAASAQQPRVNAARLRNHIERLSVFGRPAGGTFSDGVSRSGDSDADVQARDWFIASAKTAGLLPRVDAAGNICVRRKGDTSELPAILFGSHLDTVPHGGNFDGGLGSLAALEALQTIADAGVKTHHPLEVVVWANEEGVAYGNGLCGSRAAVGELLDDELGQVWNGVVKADAIRRIGGDPSRIADARRHAGSLRCYLELHIEQGGVLWNAGVPIGIVEGIVAIDRHQAMITGVANHAGTTPMDQRRDALVAASHLVIAVREIVTGKAGRQVGTVGELTVVPNAPNVVPGIVRHTIELRDLSAEKISAVADEIEARAQQIAAATGTRIEIAPLSHHDAALADTTVQDVFERAAASLELGSLRMPSGAGHDAQMLARIAPMGMIFVPSIGGVSHSPDERTSWEDCTRGADVLLQAVLAIDGMTVRS